MSTPFTPPEFSNSAFNCPYCDAYAKQHWHFIRYAATINDYGQEITNLRLSICDHCRSYCLWHNKRMILPAEAAVPIPNGDLPEDVVALYVEAKSVLNQSPRSAAALLRLAIEKLLVFLDAPGNSINDMIKRLVKNGLHPKLQQALDILRVVGNNAVHAGQIDFDDTPEVANRLFVLINVIADEMITKPKEIEDLYNSLPEKELNTIQKRDNQSTGL